MSKRHPQASTRHFRSYTACYVLPPVSQSPCGSNAIHLNISYLERETEHVCICSRSMKLWVCNFRIILIYALRLVHGKISFKGTSTTPCPLQIALSLLNPLWLLNLYWQLPLRNKSLVKLGLWRRLHCMSPTVAATGAAVGLSADPWCNGRHCIMNLQLRGLKSL